eukprot:766951-Hanusia_phi.AAC.7
MRQQRTRNMGSVAFTIIHNHHTTTIRTAMLFLLKFHKESYNIISQGPTNLLYRERVEKMAESIEENVCPQQEQASDIGGDNRLVAGRTVEAQKQSRWMGQRRRRTLREGMRQGGGMLGR